jgi:ubiquinol-cytochrome c reductase cytochrome b subunit
MWLPLRDKNRLDHADPPLLSWRVWKWGAWALVALYTSLLSGIIVGLQFDFQTPFYSTTAIDLLVPYGRFFRSLHFYSSQFFFFFSCIHLIAVYGKTEKYSRREWMQLTGTLPLILLLLFTGYVLRSDSTGSSAGTIAENIIRACPIIGSPVNSFLFSIADSGLRKVYLHHVITLDLLLLLSAWNHLRIYRINGKDYSMLIGLMFLFSIFVSAPLEPEHLGTLYISGPWFFLGLQELLRYLHPLLAGIVVPGLFLVALLGAQPAGRWVRWTVSAMGLWLCLYALLSGIAWLR